MASRPRGSVLYTAVVVYGTAVFQHSGLDACCARSSTESVQGFVSRWKSCESAFHDYYAGTS